MKRFSFFNYLLAMGVITVIFGVIYATVQQGYRTGADDPQLQMARDIKTRLSEGRPVDVFFADMVDISQSLATVAVLYDADGKPLRSSGYLNDKMLQLPTGVFDYVKTHNEDDITWQPRAGVRMAMVVVSSPGGFIAVGRSLQEVEVREHNLVIMVFIGWIICIGLLLVFAAVQFYRRDR